MEFWAARRQLLQERGYLAAAQDRYLSWDEIRYRPVPGEIAPELAWHVLADLRRANGRSVSHLTDAIGDPFRYHLTDRMMQELLWLEGAAADPLGLTARPSEADQKRFMLRTMMEEAISSSLIEGAATTRREAKALLRAGRRPSTHGERMIVNNYRTIERLAEWADRDLSVPLLCEIHASITQGTLEDPADAGRVQAPGEQRVRVVDLEGTVFHTPPSAEGMPARLERLCEFANAEEPYVPPVIRAMLLHFQLAYEHPFVDGNGRTARALFYWSLLRRRSWVMRYVSISSVLLGKRKQYNLSYVHTEQTGDLNYFLVFQLKALHQAFDNLAAYVARKRTEVASAEAALRHWPELNHRQRQLVAVALDDPARVFTIEEHRRAHGVVYQTARSDLLALVALELFEKWRQGRAHRFKAHPALADAILGRSKG